MKLGDVVSRIVIAPRKLTEYALNPNNPRGADKAVMFERHLGFNRDNYQLLLQQIESKVLDSEAITNNRHTWAEISGRFRNQRNRIRTNRDGTNRMDT